MKTLIKTLATAILSLSLAATAICAEEMMKDHLMMKDGKMVMMKADGKTTMMEKDMTLKDGTKVMTDGTVMMKGGDKSMLKDGDAITMEGKRMKHDMKK